ncbi:hypothetical protein PG993_006238 [Apiospora rasikravindrae]|uniref:Uncharacterized protein n=1 Tax=Apiospora rasikravindrae TaxID=990691 RepID=A0ABR1T552_9PEZI
MGIRHVVFPSYPPPRSHFDEDEEGRPAANPWRLEADPEDEEDDSTINFPGEDLYAPAIWPSAAWARTLPGAFGATPSSTTWGFRANDEMYRAFFD